MWAQRQSHFTDPHTVYITHARVGSTKCSISHAVDTTHHPRPCGLDLLLFRTSPTPVWARRVPTAPMVSRGHITHDRVGSTAYNALWISSVPHHPRPRGLDVRGQGTMPDRNTSPTTAWTRLVRWQYGPVDQHITHDRVGSTRYPLFGGLVATHHPRPRGLDWVTPPRPTS